MAPAHLLELGSLVLGLGLAVAGRHRVLDELHQLELAGAGAVSGPRAALAHGCSRLATSSRWIYREDNYIQSGSGSRSRSSSGSGAAAAAVAAAPWQSR